MKKIFKPTNLQITKNLFKSNNLKTFKFKNEKIKMNFARSYFASSKKLGGHGSSQHKESNYNNPNTPFEFTPENWLEAQKIIAKYPDTPQSRKSAVMPLLTLAQKQNNNWVPLSAMHKIAKILGMDNMEVYEVASFYTMYNREPLGKHFLQLCTTTPCMLGGCGSKVVQKALEEKLGIKAGETTEDGLFTLIEVECLGACVNAPMMQIVDDFYEDLTPETACKIVDDLRAGVPIKPGPQSGLRKKAEGPQGKTSLFEEPTGPYSPYLDSEINKK
eukprot:TRINITY_DN12149_c0_g1_i1.p1 TRINITY_DN12149_c0_g1~~TRINITY_DN12149_c0_g1_i1.p1  ORF type:complete len:274 (+),score=82.76 TRINITY_DN12149_c0_g1_i1:2-823(+)